MRGFVFVVALLSSAAPIQAQNGGRIVLSGDEAGISCNIVDAGGPVDVHLLHVGFTNVITLQFRAPRPDCWLGATWISDVTDWMFIGGTQEAGGWLPHYQACVSGARYLGKMVFMTSGELFTCCPYPVLKADDYHPEFPGPIAVSCIDGLIGVDADDRGVINADGTCGCSIPVPVDETTWGRVKSLYR